MVRAEEVINLLGLIPHPKEGGYFIETYKSKENISRENLPGRYQSARSFGTAIYYMLIPGTFSPLHRLKSDEIFHFYLGDPVKMLMLFPDGSSEVLTLGQDITKGEKLQVVVPNGVWQGLMLKPDSEFALMGTTVAPAFEYIDYEEGARENLLKEYPDQKELIINLTYEE